MICKCFSGLDLGLVWLWVGIWWY